MELQPGGRAADDGGRLKCLQACAYAAPCGQRIARSPDGVPSRLRKGPRTRLSCPGCGTNYTSHECLRCRLRYCTACLEEASGHRECFWCYNGQEPRPYSERVKKVHKKPARAQANV